MVDRPQRQRADCMHQFAPFSIGDLIICKFWYPWGSWNQSPANTKAEHKFWGIKSYTQIFNCVGLAPSTPALSKGHLGSLVSSLKKHCYSPLSIIRETCSIFLKKNREKTNKKSFWFQPLLYVSQIRPSVQSPSLFTGIEILSTFLQFSHLGR